MFRIVVTCLLLMALAACGPAPSGSSSTPAAKPAAPTAAKPKGGGLMSRELPPEGDCGDQSKLPADQRVANTAHWTTASEQDSFGYDIYRGESEKGPFTKINKEPVPGAGTTDETHKYQYRDDTIDPCKDYWYYIESISTKGEREKFTPVFHAVAKRRPRTGAAAPSN
ncbi:MAG: hypothetical protein U1F23_07765 [Lysobacterales bacterium]